MNREEFMKRLEYLLSDIPDEDKEDALAYYRDYLEEAGLDHEGEAINEFGSPERIAAIIRSDIAGAMDKGGEFTERGYEDERFKDPQYQVAKRYDLPEKTEHDTEGFVGDDKQEGTQDGGFNAGANGADGRDSYGSGGKDRKGQSDGRSDDGRSVRESPRTSRRLKIFLWILLLIVALPVVLGVGGGVLGLLAGMCALLLGALVTIAALTFAALLSGIVLLVTGIVYLAGNWLEGILLIGLSLLALGIGWLLLALAVLFYGRFLPWLFRTFINVVNRLIDSGRGRTAR